MARIVLIPVYKSASGTEESAGNSTVAEFLVSMLFGIGSGAVFITSEQAFFAQRRMWASRDVSRFLATL
jgi:hypothetical protein